MKVEFKRGEDTYIVEHNGQYYLVSIDAKKIAKADPPNRPDMFLKFGYFEEVDAVPVTVRNQILELLTRMPTTKS